MDRSTFILVVFIIFLLVVLIFLFFNPTARRIRKIQFLLNKERTVCDVINSIDGWSIDIMNTEGIQILIDPVVMPMYKLYITYKGKRPTNKEFKDLHNRLTNENSIVTKAHRMNMPVEAYLNWCKEQVFKNL